MLGDASYGLGHGGGGDLVSLGSDVLRLIEVVGLVGLRKVLRGDEPEISWREENPFLELRGRLQWMSICLRLLVGK